MLIDIETLKNELRQLPTIQENEQPLRFSKFDIRNYSLPTLYLGITYKLRPGPLDKEYVAKQASFIIDHGTRTFLRVLHPVNPDNNRSLIIQLSNTSIPESEYEQYGIVNYDHVHNVFVDLTTTDLDADKIEEIIRRISVRQVDTRKITFDKKSLALRQHEPNISVSPIDHNCLEFFQKFSVEEYFKPSYGKSYLEYATVSLYVSSDRDNTFRSNDSIVDEFRFSFCLVAQSILYATLVEQGIRSFGTDPIKLPGRSENNMFLSFNNRFMHRLRKYPIDVFNPAVKYQNNTVFADCIEKCVILKNDCMEERITRLSNRLYVVNNLVGFTDMTSHSEPYIMHEDDLDKLGYFGNYTRCITISEIDETLSSMINESYFDNRDDSNNNRPALYTGSIHWKYHPTIVDHTYVMYRSFGSSLSLSQAASCAFEADYGYTQYGYYKTQKEALLITFHKELLDEYQTTEDDELERLTILLSRSYQR